MKPYLKWKEEKIITFDESRINNLYNEGFLFGRNEKNLLYQTRSLRIDLSKFELSSENRRILRKTEEVLLKKHRLPYTSYDWTIGKLGKDFYTTKFGDGTFSANKIKELLTDADKSNFNRLFIYTAGTETIGYCIALETNDLIHYCYPFYQIHDSGFTIQNIGLGMMLKAIVYAKDQGKKHIYLGSAQRPSDTYKLQFEGLEWFDGETWKTDQDELKKVLP